MGKKTFKKNGYTYTVYEDGTITAKGIIPTQGIKCKRRVTPEGMKPGDQRGHLIAAQEGGVNEEFNITAQDGELNQGAYKSIENAEVRLARAGYKVETTKIAFAQNGGRPEAYMINDIITSPNGKKTELHYSFQNMSGKEQKEIEQCLLEDDSFDDYPDSDLGGLSPEEFAAAMADADSLSFSIKDEFDSAVSSLSENSVPDKKFTNTQKSPNHETGYYTKTEASKEKFDFNVAESLVELICKSEKTISEISEDITNDFASLRQFFRDDRYEDYLKTFKSATKELNDIIQQMLMISKKIEEYSKEMKNVF